MIEKKSNCCGSTVYDDSDICMDCGEHCDPYYDGYPGYGKMICQSCGEGITPLYDNGDVGFGKNCSPFGESFTCPKCDADLEEDSPDELEEWKKSEEADCYE